MSIDGKKHEMPEIGVFLDKNLNLQSELLLGVYQMIFIYAKKKYENQQNILI